MSELINLLTEKQLKIGGLYTLSRNCTLRMFDKTWLTIEETYFSFQERVKIIDQLNPVNFFILLEKSEVPHKFSLLHGKFIRNEGIYLYKILYRDKIGYISINDYTGYTPFKVAFIEASEEV